mmetsp:Transcript_12869/g.14775  ORF Transcript_12869/g.14775 Transcript_12869/m.14775 type:complete len:381 (-) Transcript_12869:829-1971(-)|eukprot:CAMPEP_0184016122 /NCGR_PEP_ID=MMETSP0954-20121128/6744_1 /TAXON_ID=627963 /ORGANISM="Aplanochytrium sp, Strain PBS07" /LENGTH=380 /DNA_ID=CAMNT_0026297089 /DNA_START=199 /DNA_END=1341 /DNA_ORIENTATION=+
MTDFADWISDTDSLPGDSFNTKDFNHVPQSRNTAPSHQTDYRRAMDLEEDSTMEEVELKQAVELKKQLHEPGASIEKKPSFGSHKGPPVIPTEEDNRKAMQATYSKDIIAFFNRANKESFTKQAISYLNAYWDEIGDQAEWIFSVAMPVFREADMHRQGITLRHLYEEGCDVDYPTYLYFYEKLCAFVGKNKKWRSGEYQKSAVYEVKTAIAHKNDLKVKVDVNFDGRISFLEFLLYQYNNVSNPTDFVARVEKQSKKHPEILKAEAALADVNMEINKFETERSRLEEGVKKGGVKGLTFKHQLTMLDSGPLADKLNESLIRAEAAVRIAVRKYLGKGGKAAPGKSVPQGSLWWIQRELEEKKKVTVPATLRRIKKNRGY